MDLLFTVSTAKSADILAPMLRACIRRGCSWQVFLTNNGVQVLRVPEITDILESHKDVVVACHDSWQRYGTTGDCPVTIGSQTNHSQMAGLAARVVSL